MINWLKLSKTILALLAVLVLVASFLYGFTDQSFLETPVASHPLIAFIIALCSGITIGVIFALSDIMNALRPAKSDRITTNSFRWRDLVMIFALVVFLYGSILSLFSQLAVRGKGLTSLILQIFIASAFATNFLLSSVASLIRYKRSRKASPGQFEAQV